MQTLIIHPEDKTTDFLCPIYNSIENKLVIRGGATKTEVLKAVKSHNRIMMMGHGSPLGLFAVGQFEKEGMMSYIVDHTFIAALQNKDNVFIWCHANKFVEQHKLTGFYSGMFISEVTEAAMYQFDVSQESIHFSNNTFSKLVSKYITESSDHIYSKVTNEYGGLANYNPIINYNNERLYYSPIK
jgi:hypothetical protein